MFIIDPFLHNCLCSLLIADVVVYGSTLQATLRPAGRPVGSLRLDTEKVNLFLRIVDGLQKQNEDLQKRIEALEQKIA